MPGKRDLDPEMSPLHFFGAEVRRVREAAAMTLADLGARVPCDASTVSRIESASSAPPNDSPRRAMRRFRRWGGWFSRFYRASLMWDGPYPRWFEDWVDAEGRATVLRGWEPLLVPGLLQTPEYARALFRAWRTDDDEDKVGTVEDTLPVHPRRDELLGAGALVHPRRVETVRRPGWVGRSLACNLPARALLTWR